MIPNDPIGSEEEAQQVMSVIKEMIILSALVLISVLIFLVAVLR